MQAQVTMTHLLAAPWLLQEGEGGQRHLSLHRLLPMLERGEVPLGTLRLLLRAAVACKALPPSWPQKLGRVQAAMQQGGRCEQCDVAARVLFATPCGHLLCVDCTSKEERGCPMCSQAYVMQARAEEGQGGLAVIAWMCAALVWVPTA